MPASIDEGFSGSSLPAGWDFYDWPNDSVPGVYSVSGGLVTVDGIRVNPEPAAYTAGRTLEFYATFSATPNEHIGFASGNNTPPNDIFNNTPPVWAIFSTGPSGTALQARTYSEARSNTDWYHSRKLAGHPISIASNGPLRRLRTLSMGTRLCRIHIRALARPCDRRSATLPRTVRSSAWTGCGCCRMLRHAHSPRACLTRWSR